MCAKKTIFKFAVLLVAALFFVQPIFADQSVKARSESSFAVVELFASNNCGDCPEAIEMINDLVGSSRDQGRAVYPLTFHVDYKNDHVQSDEFADHRFKTRQSDYIIAFRLKKLFTPQFVVNGGKQFGDVSERKLEKTVDWALDQSSDVTLEVELEMTDAGYIAHYSVSSVPELMMVNFAVVERGLSTDIAAGENAGKTIYHENVVRGYQPALAERTGKLNVPILIPDDVDLAGASLIAYAQLLEGKEIVAAVELELGKFAD